MYKQADERLLHSKNLLGYSFIIQKCGGGEEDLSFLSRGHGSIICSSSRLGRGDFLSLCGRLGLVLKNFLSWKQQLWK